MKNMRLILVIAATLPVLTACNLLASSAPTPQIVLVLPTTSAPTATKTPTTAPTATTAPTFTPTATITPTKTAAKIAPTRTTAPTAATRKILYSQCDASCTAPVEAHLWIANGDGTGATKIIDYGFSATFAPDGKRLTFTHTQGGIYVANADGSGQVRIVQGTNVREPDWSHDGQKIAFVERTKSPGPTTPEPGPPPPPPPCIPGVSCPGLFVPPGYLSLESSYGLIPSARSDPLLQQGNVFIEVVAPDGSGRRTVTIGNHPTWSLDDTQIAYDTCVGGTCGIYKIAEGGGTPVKVTDDVGSIPHWSRDGKKILYGTDVEGVRQLFVVNVDGTGKKQLTSGKDFHVDGVWSIDGNSIYYRSTEGAVWGLWVMKADGTNPRRLLSGPAPVYWGDEKLSVSK